MKTHFVHMGGFLVIGWAVACLSSRAETLSRAVDLGARPGPATAGNPVAGVNAEYFANVRGAFNEIYSIAGDIEPGVGLGRRFNGTSCGGCHAYPTPGGSSPRQNPQLAMAAAHGAINVIPPFLKADGPVLVVRAKKNVGVTKPGEILPLFTVSGRVDASHCTVDQPDFSDTANQSFRVPTPVFGAGFIDNISDTVILENRARETTAKVALGIAGRPNLSSDDTVGKFGWKAQHHSLMRFAQEAYQTEMGVSAETSEYRRKSLSAECYALYEAAYDDPNFASSYDPGEPASAFLFTEFMRLLDAPTPVDEFPGAAATSIRNGRRLVERIGCTLCHTPSLRTDDQSNVHALNQRLVSLYSDLLLHHMGPKLADGIMQGRAESDEFRTAPLWGAGQRVFFLHDGRTTDLLVAILDHASDGTGGRSEASAVIDRFSRLSPAEQQDVLNFIRSL
jgi:CxxC motif-containing protein (DUF1111 family)